MSIEEIAAAIGNDRVRVSDHADEKAAEQDLALDDILFTVLHGEILEDYPSDFPYPSCLVLGETVGGLVVHSVWAYNVRSGWAVLITVYRPDSKRWINWRQRRREK